MIERRLIAGAGAGVVVNSPILTSAPAGGWTQIPSPKGIVHNGVLYFGYVNGSNGNIEICSKDLTTGVVSAATVMHAALQQDTHAAPAVEVLPSGKIIAAYSGHSDVTHLFVWISTNPEDISAGSESNIDSQFGSDTYTYCDLMWRGSTLHLFVRSEGGGTNYLQMSTSSDGVTWAAHTDVYAQSGDQSYWRIHSDGSRIDIALSSDSNAPVGLGNLYHFYYDGSWRRSDGTSMGSPIFDQSDLTLVYSGSDPGWPTDIIVNGGNPRIVYSVSLSGNTDASWRYARWTGSAWANSTILASVGFGAAVDPSPVAALNEIVTSHAFVVRYISGHHELWLYTSSDGGATWDSGIQVAAGGVDNLYPAGVKGEATELFLAGTYTSDVNNSLGIRSIAA